MEEPGFKDNSFYVDAQVLNDSLHFLLLMTRERHSESQPECIVRFVNDQLYTLGTSPSAKPQLPHL